MAKFGTSQFGKPTPAGVSTLLDFIASMLGIINAWLLTASYISHNFSDIAGSIITGLLIPVTLNLKRFFGVNTTQTDIPIEQVGEMKETDSQTKN